MSKLIASLNEKIQTALGEAILSADIVHGELTLHVGKDDILTVLKHLRDDADCAFTQLLDVCGVDYPQRERRFDVVYHLLSMTQNARVRVKVELGETEQIPSATELFSSADWFEREAFDLYGILFVGHPDLRRLLTDYGFEGHPLRKDFPLSGHVEVRYDDDVKRVVYEPVKLVQDFRDFDFESPWEGVQRQVADVLPGDEKATATPEDGAGE